MANQEPARAVGRHFRQEAHAMLFDFRARRNWPDRVGMVEWNRIFRLFRFSGILGQPREVHPKFRNEIPENVCSIRSPTRNFRNFWSNGKRPRVSVYPPLMRFILKCEIAFLNDVSEEFVRRSLSASPFMKPFLTPGGWQLEKCVY